MQRQVDEALEKGYCIVQMHEVWHFPQNHLYYSTIGYVFSKSASVDFGYYETVEDFIYAVNKSLAAALGNDSSIRLIV